MLPSPNCIGLLVQILISSADAGNCGQSVRDSRSFESQRVTCSDRRVPRSVNLPWAKAPQASSAASAVLREGRLSASRASIRARYAFWGCSPLQDFDQPLGQMVERRRSLCTRLCPVETAGIADTRAGVCEEVDAVEENRR